MSDRPPEFTFWRFAELLSSMLIATGVVSNAVLVKLVVCKSRFDAYCRVGLGVLSASIVVYLLAYPAQPFSDWAKFLYTLSAITFFISQDAFILERIVSIRCPTFHDTHRFKWLFATALAAILTTSMVLAYFHNSSSVFDVFYGLTTQILVFANLPLVLYARRLSCQMYRADVGSYNLTRKHQLFNAYEITRSFVFALLINYAIQAVAVILMLMFKKGHYFFPEEDEAKMEFVVQIFWNINHTVYPWSVILFHRGQRDQIKHFLFPCADTSKTQLTSLDGKAIVLRAPTQNDYFQQMKVAWTRQATEQPPHKF